LAGCPACGRPIESVWRYCPWCAAPQRLKLVEFFTPHPLFDAEQSKALRVSRYLGSDDEERHVRFSVWQTEGKESAEVESAISLDEPEAGRLARFLLAAGSEAPAVEEPHTPV
jgi:hypothetical protein